MDGKRIRSLKARVRKECCIDKERLDRPDSTWVAWEMKKSKKEDTVLVGVASLEEARTQ